MSWLWISGVALGLSMIALGVLARRLKRAQAAIGSRDDRLAAVTHELRGPLQPIVLAVSRLKREEALSQKGREALEIIERNLEAEARLVDDLWDVARGDRPPSLRLEPCDVNAVAREVTDAARIRAAEKPVSLDLLLDPVSPHVLADPVRLRQIVRNLVENAIKFTPPGGRITVRCDRGEDARVTLAVTDTGIGVPSEEQARIFEPYTQLEGGRHAGGLGLGLFLVRRLVEAQGGSILVKSGGAGQGSTFTVSLPRATQAAARSPSEGTGSARPTRILLAEDHEDSARLIAELLSSRGFAVTTAGSLESALAEAGRARFDLLVSDLELPDGSGLDLMRRLRLSQNVRGIALSGRRTEADLADSRGAGFAVHLLKPIDFEALLEAIGEAQR